MLYVSKMPSRGIDRTPRRNFASNSSTTRHNTTYSQGINTRNKVAIPKDRMYESHYNHEATPRHSTIDSNTRCIPGTATHTHTNTRSRRQETFHGSRKLLHARDHTEPQTRKEKESQTNSPARPSPNPCINPSPKKDVNIERTIIIQPPIYTYILAYIHTYISTTTLPLEPSYCSFHVSLQYEAEARGKSIIKKRKPLPKEKENKWHSYRYTPLKIKPRTK